MTNKKEKCFEETFNNYNQAAAASKDKIPMDVRFQETWIQDLDQTWSTIGRYYDWVALNKELEHTRQIRDDLLPKRPDGMRNPLQKRHLDVVLRRGDKIIVLDTKFSRKNGRFDDWQEPPGQGNGKTQKQDYDDIMKKANKDDDAAEAGKLHEDTCNCDGKGSPVEVTLPSPYGDKPHDINSLKLWIGLNAIEDLLHDLGLGGLPPYPGPIPVPVPGPAPPVRGFPFAR